jgi:histidine triad (HIT) family protein
MTVFSKIVRGEIPSYKIAENERYFAFLDINPIAEGHTLVIPKCEVDYIFDLDGDTLSGLMLFAKQVAAAMRQAIPCKRIGVAVLGLEVPHAHVHLVPLNNECDMFQKKRLTLSAQEFQVISDNIRRFI